MSTAWMIRNDGTAFPCAYHTYGSMEDIEETLSAAQWLYEHTGKRVTQALCMELIYHWAVQFSKGETGLIETIHQLIDDRPYRFLSKDFIKAHAGELHGFQWERSLAEINEEVNFELNQEFLRARYGGLYDTDPASREMYFRISSVAFDWYSIIYDFVEQAAFPIESVTIVRDDESTGGKNRAYRTLSGQGVYRRMPFRDFLAERNNLAAKGKRLTIDAPDHPIRRSIIEGLSAGRSLWELHELPINWNRLKQFVSRCSRRELDLTAEENVHEGYHDT